jgi:YesN/AraC family two-component response regulator
VDDDPGILQGLRLALRQRYDLHTATSAAEARSLLQTLRPALLILDVKLPDDDGLNLLAEFRRLSDAPVLMMTGHGSEAVAARALRLRASGYLSKPFTMTAVRTEAARLLAEGPRAEHVAERAQALIEEIYAEPVSAEEIAERLGVKPRHLMEAFSARFGRTPMQCLREVRLRRAQELLLSTDLPISEVAVRTGFRDATYFDRFFKEQVGIPPGEFRRTRLPEQRAED